MGRMYSVPFNSLSLSAADTDIFEIGMNTTTAGVLHEFKIESALTTDERLHWRLLRATTSGNGTGATEVPLEPGNTVTAGASVETIATTPGTDGAILLGGCWSELAPLHYLPTPETRIVIPPLGFLALNIVTAPGAARTISGYVIWEEIG